MSKNKHCDNCKYYQYIDGKWDCKNKKSPLYNAHPNPIENCDLHSQKNAHTIDDLLEFQSYPLSIKIEMTKHRIREWVSRYGEDGVYISFSGGKDSTVLVDIVRNVCNYKDIPLVFVDVPTQYPELKLFAMTFDNLVILKPKISFSQVCEKYGFPIISKEVSNCVSGARKYLKYLDNKKNENTILTDRQTYDSVCLLHGRPARNRQENKQAERTVQNFTDGIYP